MLPPDSVPRAPIWQVARVCCMAHHHEIDAFRVLEGSEEADDAGVVHVL